MSDLERRLSEALHAERERMDARSAQDLPRIKGTIMQRIENRNRFTMFATAATAVAVVAALFALPQVLGDSGPDRSEPPVGTTSPSPEEPRPSPNESDAARAACADLPFEPTWTPKGFDYELKEGSGGQRTIPLDEQTPRAIGYYGGPQEVGYVDVYLQGDYYGVGTEQVFGMFGGQVSARFSGVEDGFGIEFTVNDCDYSLLGFGISGQELRNFGQGLILTEGSPLSNGFEVEREMFAVWPETTPVAAVEGCRDARTLRYGWRTDRVETALQFGVDFLGLDGLYFDDASDGEHFAVVLGQEGGSAFASLQMQEIAFECWAVVSIAPPSSSQPRVHGFSRRTGEEGSEIELTRAGVGRPLDADVTVLHSGGMETTERFAHPLERSLVVVFDEDPVTAGAYIAVFTQEGRVLGVSASPFPAYETAAG